MELIAQLILNRSFGTCGNTWRLFSQDNSPTFGKSWTATAVDLQELGSVKRKNIEKSNNIQIQPSLKAELALFFPHVSRAQRLAPARTRPRVVRLGAQCSDHWTTRQSRGVGVPAVQLTMHVKSSTSYGCTSKFFRLAGLLLFCIIMGLHSASSAINLKKFNQLKLQILKGKRLNQP